ncbi:MAG: hypothetical protein IK102_12020 [Treponema sp.]|nr:hypothetical protein [Treponema sp.]
MLLFLILLLPAAFTIYACAIKDRKIILPSFAGLITGVIVCACRFFFTYEHRLVYYSFGENFGYYLLKQSFLPLLLVSAVYALVSRDTLEYKIKNFFPLMCTFFAVHLPYCVITSSEFYYQAYDIFFKPVIYLAMLGQISLCFLWIYKGITQHKVAAIVINSLIIALYAIYPAVSDALYAIDYSFAVIFIIGLVYSLIPLAMLVIKQIRK